MVSSTERVATNRILTTTWWPFFVANQLCYTFGLGDGQTSRDAVWCVSQSHNLGNHSQHCKWRKWPRPRVVAVRAGAQERQIYLSGSNMACSFAVFSNAAFGTYGDGSYKLERDIDLAPKRGSAEIGTAVVYSPEHREMSKINHTFMKMSKIKCSFSKAWRWWNLLVVFIGGEIQTPVV